LGGRCRRISARLVVVNRLDRERASITRALESIHDHLGRTCVLIHLPIGEEKNFKGVIDLINMRAYTFAPDDSGKTTEGEIPAELATAAKDAREVMLEAVAEADELLMENFFAHGTLTQEELVSGLTKAIRAGKIFPVCCASGLHNIGAQTLADAIIDYLPSPVDREFPGVNDKGEPVGLKADNAGPAIAWVWKSIADPFAGRITLFRVVSGTFKSDSIVRNLSRDAEERLGHLLLLEGKTQTDIPEVHAGDLGAVAKLKDTHTGDTLGDKKANFMVPAIAFPEPVLSYAIVPKTRGDEDKLGQSMHRLIEEDPSIAWTRDAQTHDLLLSGQGQLHIEVTVAKLKRRFGVDVALKPPHIPYRETITAKTEAHGRHKKQTGGHGQFGDCKIRVEPLGRGADFEFVNDIFGGSIPRQFVPAIEKGIQDTRMRGYLAGYPMVDFRVTVFDGSYHDVDSNEMSFRMAGRLAFRDAMTRAKPTLLEPVMSVEVYSPSEFAGDLMGDLNSRRGRIAGMDANCHLECPGGADHEQQRPAPAAALITWSSRTTPRCPRTAPEIAASKARRSKQRKKSSGGPRGGGPLGPPITWTSNIIISMPRSFFVPCSSPAPPSPPATSPAAARRCVPTRVLAGIRAEAAARASAGHDRRAERRPPVAMRSVAARGGHRHVRLTASHHQIVTRAHRVKETSSCALSTKCILEHPDCRLGHGVELRPLQRRAPDDCRARHARLGSAPRHLLQA
jgi:elongation factor G